jgi:catechol 2,3-dioxygenase-like lactoylglutathione lyase family enzyme
MFAKIADPRREIEIMTEHDLMHFQRASPILRVNILDASIRYFRDVLGFTVDWREPAELASVTRGDASLMLSEGGQGNPPAWVWIGVGDTQLLCGEFQSRGARIRMDPTNFPWGLEMHVEDLDGNVIRFGSQPLPDRPFGPWRDVSDARWRRNTDESWSRLD